MVEEDHQLLLSLSRDLDGAADLPTYLAARLDTVDEINNQKLSILPTEEIVMDALDNNWLAAETNHVFTSIKEKLLLQLGCKVMVLINDLENLTNGDIGIVSNILLDTNGAVEGVVVVFDQYTEVIKRHVFKYQAGTRQQFPIMLAMRLLFWRTIIIGRVCRS